MELYTNEVVTPDRVVAAVQRFTHGGISPPMPAATEEGLLLWVNQAQSALMRRIALEGTCEPPRFSPVSDVKGLSDGAALAALISFYCPEELPWQEIKVRWSYEVFHVFFFCSGVCVTYDIGLCSQPMPRPRVQSTQFTEQRLSYDARRRNLSPWQYAHEFIGLARGFVQRLGNPSSQMRSVPRERA